MSEFAAVEATVVVPPTVSTPVSLIEPPEVTLRFWPIVEVPSTVAVVLVNCALLAPLFVRLTAPVRLFAACSRVVSAPPAKLLVRPTVAAAEGVDVAGRGIIRNKPTLEGP